MKFLARSNSLVGPLYLALRLAVASASLAQTSPDVVGSFSEAIDVRVVTIPVTVLGADGRPLSGLKREEFEIWVDGVSTVIEAFEEHGAHERTPSSAPTPDDPASRRDEPSPSSGESSPDPEPVSILFFLDEEFTLEIDLHRVLEGLEHHLSSLRPRDRVALVAWDGVRLDKLLDWSAPGEGVSAALAAARKRPAWGLRTRLDLSSWTANYSWEAGRRAKPSPPVVADARSPCASELSGAGDDCDPGESVRKRFEASARTMIVENRLERLARAVAAATRSVATPPGRRVLALLAGAWPNTGQFGPDRTLREWDALLDAADQLGYTIYGVETQGMENVWGADVEVSGLGGSSVGGGFSTVPTFGGSTRGEWRDTLSYLAARTGGQILLSPARRSVLSRISADARSYYSLTFSAPLERDDRIHEVAVAVARVGVTVRSRTSYRDLSRSTELDFALEAALLDGSAAGSSELSASFAEPRRVGRGRLRVPLVLELPTRFFASSRSTEANGHTDRVVDIRVAAVDRQGRRVLVGPTSRTLSSRLLEQELLRLELPILLRGVAQSVAVSIHDPTADRTWTASVEFLP